MTFRSRARALTTALLTTALAAVGLVSTSSPASAASMVIECKTSSIACITFSGYNGTSVWGYPVNSQGNNCVNYAAYRLRKNGVAEQRYMGNGGNWANSARSRGILVNKTPAIGSIAQWNYGSYYAPSSGHVGYVEEVTSSYIAISDSNWSGSSRRFTIPYGDPNWPSNFIHFKDVAYQPPPSGTFVHVRETNANYRLVGNSPVYASTWSAFGGTQPTFNISSTTFNKLPARPANGTFLLGAQRGEVYRMVGGAPIYVSTWKAFGGPQPYTKVDQVTLDRAGGSGVYARILKVPATTTYVSAKAPDGSVPVYAVAGGQATHVTSWASVGGVKPHTRIDYAALVNAGLPGKWSHLLSTAPSLR